MPTASRFPDTLLATLARAHILGVRAGKEHAFTGVWVVVVNGRVFVRSWNDKPSGWFRAFLKEPLGSIHLADGEVAVRGRRVRSAELQAAVTTAYAAKYPTKASQVWVRGFAEQQRLRTTLELVPP